MYLEKLLKFSLRKGFLWLLQLEGGTFREKTLSLQKFSECQMVAGCPVSQFVRLDYIFISICAFQIVVTSVIICYSLSCFINVSVEK